MHDPIAMKILQTLKYMLSVYSSKRFIELLIFSKQNEDASSGNIFQENIEDFVLSIIMVA